jgi:hypothetical protein
VAVNQLSYLANYRPEFVCERQQELVNFGGAVGC